MQDESNTIHPVTLVVGDMILWQETKRLLPDITRLHFMDINDLDARSVQALQPEIIFSPLLIRESDVIEIARLLNAVGYMGRYCVLAISVPHPALIEAEVRGVAPLLDFVILNLCDSALAL